MIRKHYVSDLIPDISHTTSWPETYSHRPQRRAGGKLGWGGVGGAAMADRSAIETSTVMLLGPGEKKLSSSWSSEPPRVVQAGEFFHRAAPWPWQAVSEASVISGRLQEEVCKSLEAALCSLQEKVRAKFTSHWWRASALWRLEVKGGTSLVSCGCQPLWPLLTSSSCLSFQSRTHQIGQRKERNAIKHSFSRNMASK